MPFSEQYDVVVVGAGHAGCEAAMAAARMGLKTALITMNMDLIAQMSCNPAIGGGAKGHLVREVDALGEVLEAQSGLHIRQAEVVGLVLAEEPGTCDSETGNEGSGDRGQPSQVRRRVLGLKLRDGRQLMAGSTIITTGTFLNGLIHCGEQCYPAGRSGERASER